MVEAGQIDWGAHDNDGAYVLRAMQSADETLAYLMDYADAHPDTLLIVTADHETGGMGFSCGQIDDATMELPSGATHTTPFDFAVATESFDDLTEQTMSYAGMVDSINADLYLEDFEPNSEYPIEDGIQELIALVDEHTGHSLSEEQAMQVLHVEPTTATLPQPQPQPQGPDRFHPHDTFRNRLSMQLVDDTHLLWSTGTHTSTPVPIMAMGKPEFAEQVRGHGHSVAIGALIFAALND